MLDEARLKKVVETVLEIPAGGIDDQTNTDTVPTWDSLHHMNLILALEEEFGVTIPDEEAGNLTSYPLLRVVLSELMAIGA